MPRTIIVLGTFYSQLSKKHRSVIITGEPRLPALLFNINLLVQSKDTKMARSQNHASRSYHWIPTIFATISPNLSRFKSEERSPKKPESTWGHLLSEIRFWVRAGWKSPWFGWGKQLCLPSSFISTLGDGVEEELCNNSWPFLR